MIDEKMVTELQQTLHDLQLAQEAYRNTGQDPILYEIHQRREATVNAFYTALQKAAEDHIVVVREGNYEHRVVAVIEAMRKPNNSQFTYRIDYETAKDNEIRPYFDPMKIKEVTLESL